MGDPVRILVATQGGTAELCALEIADVLADNGFDPSVRMMGDFGPEVFADGGFYIVCTSTYGYGEVPDNGKALHETLERDRPDLSDVRFAVFGLGDSSYEETFNFGGAKFDAALAACGADRVIERHVHDAGSGRMAEDEALEWIAGWLDAVGEKAAA